MFWRSIIEPELTFFEEGGNGADTICAREFFDRLAHFAGKKDFMECLPSKGKEIFLANFDIPVYDILAIDEAKIQHNPGLHPQTYKNSPPIIKNPETPGRTFAGQKQEIIR